MAECSSSVNTPDNPICERSDSHGVENETQSIVADIVTLLQLAVNENREQIVNDLLENGRQSLANHKKYIAPEVYTTVMDNKSSILVELLKKYFQQMWKMQHCASNEWFALFLKQYRSEENIGIFERVLTRTAEYGNKYMKTHPMLSIVLQLLFEAMDDQCLQETSVFNELWLTVTDDGLKSITKYVDYIVEDVMNEQINAEHSALFQALREYYQPQLFSLLQQSNIINRQHLYDLVLDNVTRYGWLTGVQIIKGKAAPKSYEKLLENIRGHLAQQQLQENGTNHNSDQLTPSTSMKSDHFKNRTSRIHNEAFGEEGQETLEIFQNDSKMIAINTNNASTANCIEKNTQYIQQTCISLDGHANRTIIHSNDYTGITSECQSIPITTDYDVRKELSLIRSCKNTQINQFQFQDLIQAGELQYNNQTLDHITQKLVHNLNHQCYSFPKFILDGLTPIMYLLKRQQNLDDFFSSLTFQYQGKMGQSTEDTNISLRMLLHMLFTNSNQFLQRIIMSLLSKRNPVPFISPNVESRDSDRTYEFMPSIIHVWNFTRPTILSFGIGPCKGKSTLLNQLFQSTFEQTVNSIYFQQTIDIDFGYCFNPERALNVADTHGMMSQSLLEQIHSLFDAFLIHVDKTYLDQQPQILVEYLRILPENKFRMVIIRDTPIQNIHGFPDRILEILARSRINTSQHLCIYPLINICNTNDRNVTFAIKNTREDLLRQIHREERKNNNNNIHRINSNLRQLMKGQYVRHLEDINSLIQPLKGHLLQKNQQLTAKNFPLYLKFQELCKLRQTLKKLDFYGSESENMFEIYEKLNKLEGELEPSTKTSSPIITGQIFNLFIDLLKSEHMLMSLDLLSAELKSKLLSLGGDKIAGELAVENAFLSLEVLWRNAIVCYDHTATYNQDLIKRSYFNFIAAGFPFEIIDGDNLSFQHKFLTSVLQQFGSKRILVISIVGPQNSGKSTLLNYMFGTLFDVREGRCTRGIYGSFVKLARSNQNSKSQMPDIDYIMLIDTEGLLSIEKSDSEYDRRLVLFCLAVSHLVIVNMMGDVNETLKDMLTLCADSLKQIGVNKVNQPIVHFVLNQKADPNLKNHAEAIDRIVRDFKEKELAEVIDISSKTFHTLPSAFKKERVANDPQSPCLLRTEPDFIQRTQQLCDKIIESAKSLFRRVDQTFYDPLQWLRTSVNVFDTLQKFPDLTYFKDINERRQDDRIRQHIGELIAKTLSADYRTKTITDLCEFTENEIRQQLQAKFDVHQNDLDNELKIIFKATNASERIRERSKQFLNRQVTEIRNAWCTAVLQAHDQKQMEVLVRDGSEELRKLIDDLIRNGQTMTREETIEEFEMMWNKKIESINKNFNPQERLKQAIKFVYGNYNIFEKQCLPSHDYILNQLPIISKLSEKTDSTLVVAAVQGRFAQNTGRGQQSALEDCWEIADKNTTYTLTTVDKFNYLNKQILKDYYFAADSNMHVIRKMAEVGENNQISKKTEAKHSKRSVVRRGIETVTNFFGLGASEAESTEPTVTVINSVPIQIDFIRAVHWMIYEEMNKTPMAKSNILCLTTLFNKIVTDIANIVIVNDTKRPIEVDLIQKIVGVINTNINEVNLELVVFKLALSKQTKSSMHTYILMLLTIFYYDEQKNHFHQQILTLNREKPSLLTYFISMAVPDAQCDNEGAELLVNKVKNAVQSSFARDAQIIITRHIEAQQNLNRKQIQIICDGKLHAAADDDNWLFRYIDAPTDIIVEEFQILWHEVEKTINQQLEKEKNQWKNILTEFFHRIGYIISCLTSEGSAVQFIDDIFAASGGIAAENLTNKGQCMALLLYAYLSGDKIQPGTSYTIFSKSYTLNTKGLKVFERLPSPSPKLATLIRGMKDTDTVNNKRTTIASIKNLHVFLRSIMDVQDATLEAYDRIPTTFEVYDKAQSYNKMLDKVRGCTSKCPCCQRPCDVDHTLVKSNAGDEDNRHCCQTGHQLRAMSGIKFEITNEASLFQCEQMTDDRPIVVRGTKKRWQEFKNDHPDWDFGNSITPDELFKLRGKLLNVWRRIGKVLCEKYDMEFVTENAAQAATESFHYIMLLDASGSMKGQPWRDLLTGVGEFIKIRVDARTFDQATIITFSDQAKYAYVNEDIKSIRLNEINISGGGTNFSKAFDLVIQTIQNTQSKCSDYIIIFMSDGKAAYPSTQMATLSTMKSSIHQFWTVALGDTSMDVLQQINNKMDGVFKELKDSTDFVHVYAEIARN